MKYTVLIPAAGSGKRMALETNKVLLKVKGKTVLEHTVSKFDEDIRCENIIVAAKESELAMFEELLSWCTKLKGVVIGGDERQDSIQNMLNTINDSEYVMVHDAARPNVSLEILKRLTDALDAHDAVICGVQPKDTIKMLDVNDSRVEKTIPRDTLILTHTPQAFRTSVLKEAYKNAEQQQLTVTDDSMMVEALGTYVHVVPSSYENIKITTQDDLRLIDVLMDKF